MVRRNRGLVAKGPPQRESNVPAEGALSPRCVNMYHEFVPQRRFQHKVEALQTVQFVPGEKAERMQLARATEDSETFTLADALDSIKRADPCTLDIITDKIACLTTAPVPPCHLVADELRGPLERYSKRSTIKSSLSKGRVAVRPTCHAT
jgi:hypothetical protein